MTDTGVDSGLVWLGVIAIASLVCAALYFWLKAGVKGDLRKWTPTISSDEFIQLNQNWRADPNVPEPAATCNGHDVTLTFDLNTRVIDPEKPVEKAEIQFSGCSHYGFGPVNDEGWFRGQCRYSQVQDGVKTKGLGAPGWGEFYEVTGDSLLNRCNVDWNQLQDKRAPRHFLFYFRDNTFECFAEEWTFKKL